MSGSNGGGPDFWTRRKTAVRAAEEAEQAEKAERALAEQHAELEQKPEPEILEELGLPDPDTLGAQDDFSGFMRTAVPEALRRRALRRLWTLNPVLANLDGLVDYADDFTDAATVIPNMQTVYQVGKGMFDKVAAAAEAEEKKRAFEAQVASRSAPSSSGPASDSASGRDAGSGEVDEDGALSGEGVVSAERDAELHGEENDALHNDYCQNRKTSFQLTQGVEVVQSEPEGVRPDVVQGSSAVEMQEEPRNVRRRMRFDYS